MFRKRIRKVSVLVIPSTQDLIDEAYLTGDWTLVNQRFAAIERRAAEQPPLCPTGTKAWCKRKIRGDQCSCVDDTEFRDSLESLIRYRKS